MAAVLLLIWAPGAAQRLVSERPVGRCDLMIILEGGALERIATGVELYSDGACENVLLTGEYPDEAALRSRSLLADLGSSRRLPSGRITRSTFEDALVAREAAERGGFDHLLVITSPYHTKRVGWLFSRVLQGTGMEFGVLASQSFYMDYRRWWGTSYGRRVVLSEHAKLWMLGAAAHGLALAASAAALGATAAG
jgi:uncharacterized SAM-binding protein YcdF (DUF218 family)